MKELPGDEKRYSKGKRRRVASSYSPQQTMSKSGKQTRKSLSPIMQSSKEGRTKRILLKADSIPLSDLVMYQHPMTAFGPAPSPPNKKVGSLIKVKSGTAAAEANRLVRLSASTEKLPPPHLQKNMTEPTLPHRP
tara:strand:- start:1038 stop:1442 length:405 start_codon:yes stop_codon:yes gene_type:complete